MFQLLLLIFSFGILVSSSPNAVRRYDLQHSNQLFEELMVTYRREYQIGERRMRFKIFKDNLKRINRRNMESKTATFGINRFTDMTIEETLQKMTCLRLTVEKPEHCTPASKDNRGPAPESLDWRDQNKVTKVKDQAKCGSCWAFSAVGNLEGQYAIKHNDLRDFSEQQLVDCDREDEGCGGGMMSSAFMWLKENGGIEPEEDYPYVAIDEKCRFDKNKALATVTGCLRYNGSNEDVLKQYLATTGPLSIGVNAFGMFAYQGGILDNCNGGNLNHGVLLVGYGTENGTPFWIIKNSWGEDYGEKGYVRVKMYENSCGMTDFITSAIVN